MFEYYLAHEHHLAQLQLVLFMLGMGATLTIKDFFPIFKQPTTLLLGLCCVLVLTPLLAFGFNEMFHLEGGIAIGLILVGTLPGGTLSNVFTYVSRGNVALSIALSAIGTLLSIVTIPLLLQLLASEFMPADFEMPVSSIIREIVLCVLLPLALGMVIARFIPHHKDRAGRICMRIGFVLVVVMVVGSLGSGRVHLGKYHLWAPLLIIFFCILSQQLMMLPFRLARWPASDFVALGLEVTIRNVYLGLLLATLFPVWLSNDPEHPDSAIALREDVMFVVLFYGATSMAVGLPLALRIRRLLRKQNLAVIANPHTGRHLHQN